jgi:hypothetical protein
MPSNGTPLFSRDFPRTPALDAIVDAFARGDYARVRTEGARIAETTDDDKVRQAALALVARTNPDPLALWLLVLAGALLAVLSGYWIVHGKAPPGTPSAPQMAPPSDGGP